MTIAVLFQGLAERAEAFMAENSWLNGEHVYVLTYDRPLPDSAACVALFDNVCTWAEGRNKLLETARKRSPYDGFIFMDDDVGYLTGSFELFFGYCTKNPRLFIAPVSGKAVESGGVLAGDYQRTLFFDDQIYYVPSHIIELSKCYPLCTKYDHISWYIACEISQRRILQYHWKETLQINIISTSNELHRHGPESRYKLSPDFLRHVREYVHDNGMQSLWYWTYHRKPKTGRRDRWLWRAFRWLRRLRAPIPSSGIVEPKLRSGA